MNRDRLLALLSELRAYSLPLSPKSPDFERTHLRGQGGRFQRKTPRYDPQAQGGFHRGEAEADSPLAQLHRELGDVTVPTRRIRFDTHAGYDVTSGLGQPHLVHPIARGIGGENLERAFHALVQGGGTSGFTVTYAPHGTRTHATLGRGVGDPAVLYPYYYAGLRSEGQPNADHVHDLVRHLGQELGDHAQVELHRHLGHVKNFGWHVEDHMERVHSNDGGVRRDPDGALGIERTAQAALALHAAPGKHIDEQRDIVRTAAQVIRERARDQGYLWDVPDLRLIGTTPHAAESDQWIRRPMFTVESPHGLYTALHQGTAPEVERDLMRGLHGYSRDVHIPAAWGDILGELSSAHLSSALKAAQDGRHD